MSNPAQANNNKSGKVLVGGNIVSDRLINDTEVVITALHPNNFDDTLKKISDDINISEGAENDNGTLENASNRATEGAPSARHIDRNVMNDLDKMLKRKRAVKPSSRKPTSKFDRKIPNIVFDITLVTKN